ncbi:MAG TPA: hypothetical protein VL551_32085 [Actinospica sp.]|jgi:hypothetical protein|nr:hypothetical protein [Actinospica sp.]
MPESFDTMLAELAEAAADATVPPGLAEVRRRARQRTLTRRMTASAFALMLVGLTGGAWAVAEHRSARTEAVAPMAGPSAASAARGPRATASEPGGIFGAPIASPSQEISAFTNGSDAVVWKTAAAKDGYLMVFSDGTVALSSMGSFPLCYARLAATAESMSPATVVSASAQPLADVACDDFGTNAGVFAAPVSNGTEVLVSTPTSGEGAVYTYSRVASFSSTQAVSAVARTALLKQLTGTWISADSEKRSLAIGVDGSIQYTAYVTGGKPSVGIGTIDTNYPTGARAVFDCANGDRTPCQVLLIELAQQSADQITVYGSYGPESFIRKG